MTVSRVLPATLAPRFARARRAVCTLEDASFEVVVAERFLMRLRGLSGLDAGAMVPLLFPRCRSLHTFGMRAPIDVAWLDLAQAGEGEVLAVEPDVLPRRTVRAPGGAPRRRVGALELPAGDARALGLAPARHITTSAP